MTKPFVWMLLTSLLLGAVGCSSGKEAGSGTGTTPVVTNGANAEIMPTCEPPMEAAPAMVISPFVHHTPGDVALVIARPSRAMNNPIVTGMIKEIEAADPSVNVADQLKKMEEELGIDPKQIEYVVVSVSSQTLAAVAPQSRPQPNFGPPPVDKAIEFQSEIPGTEPSPLDEKKESPCADEPAAADESTTSVEIPSQSPALDEPPMASEDLGGFELPPSPAVLVRLLTPVDGESLVAKMADRDKARAEMMFGGNMAFNYGPNTPKEILEQYRKENEEHLTNYLKSIKYQRSEHGGLTLHQKGDSKDRFCFLNSQTVLMAPEAVVKAAIDRQGTAASSPLSAQLQPLVDRDFAVALDLAPVAEMSKSGQLELPFPVMLFAAPLLKCRFLSVAADINGADLLQVNLVAADEVGAKQLHGMLNPLLTDSIAKAKAAKDAPGQLPAEASPFLPLGEKMLDGTKLTQAGDLLSLVVARPAGLEDLPTLARPMLVESAKKAQEAAKRNDLKQIALGLHNYHETYQSLPANDQGATGSAGLSWRVHILPFVDAAPLYNEFHMDEPWDSEHNKALIPRMPKVYGTSAEGKTSVHVFIGEGTPFGGKPIGFQDITDGTSNTIMDVRAGEDTADIWTKPGGLTFDKANPSAALGNIGDFFDVGLMDGSVRRLPKTIDAATLGNLIIHNDGNVVEIPE